MKARTHKTRNAIILAVAIMFGAWVSGWAEDAPAAPAGDAPAAAPADAPKADEKKVEKKKAKKAKKAKKSGKDDAAE
jgi:hypothetical protein